MVIPKFIFGYQEHLLSSHSFKPRKHILVLVETTVENPSILRCAERVHSNKSRQFCSLGAVQVNLNCDCH